MQSGLAFYLFKLLLQKTNDSDSARAVMSHFIGVLL